MPNLQIQLEKIVILEEPRESFDEDKESKMVLEEFCNWQRTLKVLQLFESNFEGFQNPEIICSSWSCDWIFTKRYYNNLAT